MNDRESQEPRIRALVVADYELLRIGLVQLLPGNSEIEVVAEASDARSGVQLAFELRPDVVLMALWTAPLDGPEATRAILARHPETRVLALTDRATDDTAAAMQAGACGCLPVRNTSSDDTAAAVRAAAGRLSRAEAEDVLERMRREAARRRRDLPCIIRRHVNDPRGYG
jgi:DNA-binding NarL/FixJ family response regulator